MAKTYHIDPIVYVSYCGNTAHDNQCCDLQAGEHHDNDQAEREGEEQPVQQLTLCVAHLRHNQPTLEQDDSKQKSIKRTISFINHGSNVLIVGQLNLSNIFNTLL